MNRTATREQFVVSGIAGAVVALALSLLIYLAAPALDGLALLSVDRMNGPLPAMVFLLFLGLIAAAELPIVLFLLVRMARAAMAAYLVNGVHFAYIAFPAFHGMLGVILTGQRWWVWPMLLLSAVRLVTSVIAIDPRQMAERQAAHAPVENRPPTVPNVKPQRRAQAGRGDAPLPGSYEQGLGKLSGFVLDMDGVLYRGDAVREGAIEFIEFLNAENIPYVCLTNNASRTSNMYQDKLDGLGIPIDSAHVLGSAQATAEWLLAHAARGARVLVVGEVGLRQELSNAGFTLVDQGPADYVVVGIDFELSYERLKEAALAIQGNAQFIGTNPDNTFPREEGLLPGNGATLAFLEAATGVAPTIIGKPSKAIMDVAVAHLDVDRVQVAMVGDRLNTDILGGRNAGLTTILLRGGVTSDDELAHSDLQPDYVFDDLGELLGQYRQARVGSPSRRPASSEARE